MMQMIHKMLDWFKSLFWKEEMELTLVGLQHAGKTTFVNVIASGQFNEVRREGGIRFIFLSFASRQDMIPTVGFNMRKITKGNVTIKLWDIGGQPRFRSMWERYCRGVNAIVYMVDAADPDKIEASRNELHNLLDRPQLAGIPILVLGNKRDLPGEWLIHVHSQRPSDSDVLCLEEVLHAEKSMIVLQVRWMRMV